MIRKANLEKFLDDHPEFECHRNDVLARAADYESSDGIIGGGALGAIFLDTGIDPDEFSNAIQTPEHMMLFLKPSG